MQARHEIRWNEGAIPGDRSHPSQIRPMRRSPFQPGQNPRQRPGVIGQRVCNHRQAISRETRGVAIRIQRYRGDLRRNPRQHMIQQGPSAE
jgi:hypothetical protein